MKKTGIVCLLLVSMILFSPSVNAQVVSETEIKVNNEVVVEHSTARSHHIKITKGDSVRVIHTLYNYFDAEWVDIDVSYSVVSGENLISDLSTSGLSTFWNRKGEWTNFEFYFVAEQTGRVSMVFRYNGTYWEQFPTSQPIPFSSIASFSSLTFEIVEVGLPYIPILLVFIGVAVILASSMGLYYKKRSSSKKLNTNTS